MKSLVGLLTDFSSVRVRHRSPNLNCPGGQSSCIWKEIAGQATGLGRIGGGDSRDRGSEAQLNFALVMPIEMFMNIPFFAVHPCEAATASQMGVGSVPGNRTKKKGVMALDSSYV